MRQERLFFYDLKKKMYLWLTLPGEESGQKLDQTVPGISAILGSVVVGELP